MKNKFVNLVIQHFCRIVLHNGALIYFEIYAQNILFFISVSQIDLWLILGYWPPKDLISISHIINKYQVKRIYESQETGKEKGGRLQKLRFFLHTSVVRTINL